MGLSIGTLARDSGCSVQTIRYYEKIGLMPPAGRSVGNQRVYDRGHADRLIFIRHARDLGFSLDAIRELLDLVDRPSQSCAAVDAIARTHLAAVKARIARLQSLKVELERMIETCAGGTVGDCRVIDALGAREMGAPSGP